MRWFLIGIMMLALHPLFSQNRSGVPRWVTEKAPYTATSQSYVASGKTLEEARLNAIKKLMTKAKTVTSHGSYQQYLIDNGKAPINQQNELVAAALNSSFFPTVRQYQGDNECWVMCEMSVEGLISFSDSLYKVIREGIYPQVLEARTMKQKGNIVGAAMKYTAALQDIIPMVHKPLYCTEGSMVEVLQKDYISCFDDIELHFGQKEIAVVRGKEDEQDIEVSATCNNQPIKDLPVSFSITGGGKISGNSMTDSNGKAHLHINQMPTSEKSKITVIADVKSLAADLPTTIFSSELNQHLAHRKVQAELSLTAIEPDPYFFVDIPATLVSFLADSVAVVMKESGQKMAKKENEADYVIYVDYKSAPDGPVTPGKYALQYYNCQLSFTINERKSLKKVASAEKTDFRMLLHAGLTEDQVRPLAIEELYKRVKSSLKSMVNKKYRIK